MLFLCSWGKWTIIASTHSVSGVQTVYQDCCRTQRNVMVWKPKQMRIWVSTEKSRGPEIRPDGGRRDTSSFQAGFRLTEEVRWEKTRRCKKIRHYRWGEETWSKRARQIPMMKLNASPYSQYFSYTYWWKQWGGWWQYRWRGTGSLQDYWGSKKQNSTDYSLDLSFIPQLLLFVEAALHTE